MTFKASLDNLAKGTTIAVAVLFAVLIIGQAFLIKDTGPTVPILIITLLSAIYFGTFSFRPVGYLLTPDDLFIQRPLSDVRISRKEIKSIEQLDKSQLEGSIRTFGVGGLFGYWGRFANRQIGNMTWYATRRDRAVLVTTIHDKKIILTPDEPAQFVAAFS